MTVRILAGHVLDKLAELPEASVHCAVTSIPYYGLRSYGTEPQVWGSDAWRGELGLEPDPLMYVGHVAEVFRAVWRVLRPDATLWLNVGDSYAGSGKGTHDYRQEGASLSLHPEKYAALTPSKGARRGWKAKDLYLIPERLAIALQDDGWYVRSRIAWCKTSAMPESVEDRPTTAWEHFWLLTKEPRYFYDASAVRTPGEVTVVKMPDNWDTGPGSHGAFHRNGREEGRPQNAVVSGANLRNYWLLGPEPQKPIPGVEAQHYAAFPTEIPRRAILAGTSERGCCPSCGAPWRRLTTRQKAVSRLSGRAQQMRETGLRTQWGGTQTTPAGRDTTGWGPSCACNAGDPVPCTVLDPFLGSGTTALVADRLGRDCVGIELQPKYIEIAERRLQADAPLFATLGGDAA